MRKLLTLLLALTLVASLAGCRKEKPMPTSPNATALPTEPENTVYMRDTYSVPKPTAIADRDKVVARVGDGELTNGLLQIFYWNAFHGFCSEWEGRLVFYGLDPTQPLDTQKFMKEEGTWQHFFLEKAIGTWHNYQLMALQAQKEGVPMDPQIQAKIDALPQVLEESRAARGFESVDEMIQADAGPAATGADFVAYQTLYYQYYHYYNHVRNSTSFTDAEVEAWFEENEQTLASKGITKDTVGYDVRHILIRVAEGKSDADWDKCRSDAQALLDQWLAGDADESSFAALAREHSQDTGSNANGGLYADVTANTTFNQTFKDWYLDESRQTGDYGLVKSDTGWHLVYFCGSGTFWMDHCREAMTDNAVAERLNGLILGNPPTIDYEKISLGIVNLSK